MEYYYSDAEEEKQAKLANKSSPDQSMTPGLRKRGLGHLARPGQLRIEKRSGSHKSLSSPDSELNQTSLQAPPNALHRIHSELDGKEQLAAHQQNQLESLAKTNAQSASGDQENISPSKKAQTTGNPESIGGSNVSTKDNTAADSKNA